MWTDSPRAAAAEEEDRVMMYVAVTSGAGGEHITRRKFIFLGEQVDEDTMEV